MEKLATMLWKNYATSHLWLRLRQRHNRKHGIDKNVDFLLRDLFLAQLIYSYIFICLTSRLIAGRFFVVVTIVSFVASSFGCFFTAINIFFFFCTIDSFVNTKTVIKLLFLLICTKNTCAGQSRQMALTSRKDMLRQIKATTKRRILYKNKTKTLWEISKKDCKIYWQRLKRIVKLCDKINKPRFVLKI